MLPITFLPLLATLLGTVSLASPTHLIERNASTKASKTTGTYNPLLELYVGQQPDPAHLANPRSLPAVPWTPRGYKEPSEYRWKRDDDDEELAGFVGRQVTAKRQEPSPVPRTPSKIEGFDASGASIGFMRYNYNYAEAGLYFTFSTTDEPQVFNIMYDYPGVQEIGIAGQDASSPFIGFQTGFIQSEGDLSTDRELYSYLILDGAPSVPYGTRQLRNGRRTVIYGEEPFYYETVAFRVAPGGAITSEYVQNDGTVLAPQYFNYKFDYGIGVVYVAGNPLIPYPEENPITLRAVPL